MILEIDKFIFILAILIFFLIIPIILVFKLTQFKLIENNSSKLFFALRPVFHLSLASILCGIGIVIAIYLLFNNYLVTLDCHKILDRTTTVQCNLDAQGIALHHQNKFISNLKSAKLSASQEDREGDNILVEPILIATDEEMNIGRLFNSYNLEKSTEIVNDIENFINYSSEQEFQITKDESSFIISLVRDTSIFFLLSLFVTTLSPYQYCSFDSCAKNFILMRKSFF